MNLTQEQQEIVAHCKSIYTTEGNTSTELVVLINSVAGS
jgi:hypothetical protein